MPVVVTYCNIRGGAPNPTSLLVVLGYQIQSYLVIDIPYMRIIRMGD